MDPIRGAWEGVYHNRSRVWGGSPVPLPGLPPSGRILELGCGDGRMVASLVDAGYHVIAVDFALGAARICHNRYGSSGKADVLAADCQFLPYRDGSIDIVIASHVTGHLSEAGRSQIVREIFRVLADGGMVYFREFSREDFRYGRGGKAGTGTIIRSNGITTHYFDTGEVKELFSSLSLKSLEEQRWNLRVRGTVYPRAEIVAVFEKFCGNSNVRATNPM